MTLENDPERRSSLQDLPSPQRDTLVSCGNQPRVNIKALSLGHALLFKSGNFFLRTLEGIFVCALLLCVGIVCFRTVRWPLVGDNTLIHYAVFLMDSGLRPYVDFRDVNLPGAYAEDWLVMHVLGSGALAERIYDFALSAIALSAILYLCPRRLRFAGFFAGCMFFLIHTRDGPRQIGQRDLSIAVLILLAFALSFAAFRSGRKWPHLLSGLLLGAATTVKPVAVVFAGPLLIGPWIAEGSAALLLTASGFLIPLVAAAAWLGHEGALRAFLTTGLGMMRYHASLDHMSRHSLILRSITPLLPLLIAGVVLVPSVRKKLQGFEFAMLCGGVAAAFLCYAIQEKGYPYQRYPFTAFLLLTLGLIFTSAMHDGKTWQKWLAITSLAAACFVIGPLAARRAVAYRPQDDQFGALLSHDLRLLGTDGLSGNVQCLDTFSGCIRVLYDLRLRESTSTVYDEFLFSPSNGSAIATSRAAFNQQIRVRPPEAIIVTPQFYSEGRDSYDKISTWPDFAQYLSENYQLYVQRTPIRAEFWEGTPCIPVGYRIYLRKAQ